MVQTKIIEIFHFVCYILSLYFELIILFLQLHWLTQCMTISSTDHSKNIYIFFINVYMDNSQTTLTTYVSGTNQQIKRGYKCDLE